MYNNKCIYNEREEKDTIDKIKIGRKRNWIQII